MDEIELFNKSVKLWGLSSQLCMLAEEAGELSTAALHLNRDNKNKAQAWNNLAEEIADTEFMIAEFKHLFPRLAEAVTVKRCAKAARLEILLEEFGNKLKASYQASYQEAP